jgi:hypothetical protein
MTTLAAPGSAKAAVSRVSVTADAVVVAGLVLLAVGLTFLTWETWGDPTRDTGYDPLAGIRLADGELPYRDFTYYYGPLAPAVLGLAALVGGAGLLPATIVGLGLAAVCIGMTYLVGRLVVPVEAAAAAAVLVGAVAFGSTNLSYVQPHTVSATLGIVLTLALLLCAGRYAATSAPRWLAGASLAVGAACLTRPEIAAAALLAGGAWLAVRRGAGLTQHHEVRRACAAAIALPAVVYTALAVVVGPSRLAFENLYPLETLRNGGSTILRSHAPLTLSSFAELGVRAALYALGAAILVAVARSVDSRRGRILLAVAGTVVVVAALVRLETVRYWLEFVYGWIPLGAAVATGVVVIAARRRTLEWTPARQVELMLLVVLTVLGAKSYAAFFLFSERAQVAVYAAPFAALFLAVLHTRWLGRYRGAAVLGVVWIAFLALVGLGLTLKDARAESVTVEGPGGAIAMTPTEADLYQPVVDWLDQNTRPGRPILVAPQDTWLYVVARRLNRLPELSLLPGALPSAADERAAVEQLSDAGVRVAIVDTRRFAEYGHTRFGESFDRGVSKWIRRDFVRAATFGPAGRDSHALEIWLRRGT